MNPTTSLSSVIAQLVSAGERVAHTPVNRGDLEIVFRPARPGEAASLTLSRLQAVPDSADVAAAFQGVVSALREAARLPGAILVEPAAIGWEDEAGRPWHVTAITWKEPTPAPHDHRARAAAPAAIAA